MPSGKPRDLSTTYLGTPCKRFGHTTRYKNSHACAECEWLSAADPERKRLAKEAAERYRNSAGNTIKLRYLKQRYGITPEEYEALEKAQDGKCAICKQPPSGRWKRLHVDHDHKTKKIRGLLCFKCNAMLGQCDDNIETLRAAISYVSTHCGTLIQ